MCRTVFLNLQAAENRINLSVTNYLYTLGSFSVKIKLFSCQDHMFSLDWSSRNIQLLERTRSSDPYNFYSEGVDPCITS